MSSDLDKEPWNRFKALPEHEQQIIEALKGVEAKQQNLQYEFQLELLQLRRKYASLLESLYERRTALVAGDSKPESAELDAGEQALQKLFGKEFKPPSRRPIHSNGIANFWLAVFMNHTGLSMIIAPRDQKALEHLSDIRCTYFAGNSTAPKPGTLSYASAASDKAVATVSTVSSSGPSEDPNFGYKLSFYFSRNDYFSNEILEKTYYYKQGKVDESGELMYEKAVGCPIYWKSGVNLTEVEVKGNEEEDGPSFFTFFDPKNLPSEVEVEKMNDEEYGNLLDDIEGDFECGEDIRDQIIPSALTYLIDPPEFDDDEEEEEEEEEDNDDSEEEDTGDEDDDSD